MHQKSLYSLATSDLVQLGDSRNKTDLMCIYNKDEKKIKSTLKRGNLLTYRGGTELDVEGGESTSVLQKKDFF